MLYKAISHKKEHRKPWCGAKAIDCTYRNHGTCDWCKSNRLHKFVASKFLKADSHEDDGLISYEGDTDEKTA